MSLVVAYCVSSNVCEEPKVSVRVWVCVCVYVHTGCPRRKGQNFGGVFLMLKYTDITQNTYIQS